MKVLLRILVSLVLLAAIGGVAGAYLAQQHFEAPGPLASDTAVVIPPGAGVAQISQILADDGIIGHPLEFRVAAEVSGSARNLKAGEFAIPAGVSLSGVIGILRDGRTIQHFLTVPEGLPVREVIALVEADDRLSGTIADRPTEGSILPETYGFVRNTDRQELIDRMRQAMDTALAEAWAGRDDGLPLTSPEEVLVLASIIEKETGIDGERHDVAGVFVNRLNIGMRLQSDPTVIYAITQGQAPLGRALTRQDWKFESAYNTYVVTGLPPGPIANPGRAAIDAAVHPADVDYLYFVADGTGGHAFARTLAEHNRNVAQWRKVRDAQ